MTTRQFLSRAYHLDRKIKSKIDQIAEMEALATKVSAILNDVKVQTSVDNHKTENAVIKMLEYQEELNDELNNLIEIKAETKKAIDAVSDDECKLVLEMRYLLYKSWEEIAVELNYGIDNIYRIHRNALNLISVPIAKS